MTSIPWRDVSILKKSYCTRCDPEMNRQSNGFVIERLLVIVSYNLTRLRRHIVYKHNSNAGLGIIDKLFSSYNSHTHSEFQIALKKILGPCGARSAAAAAAAACCCVLFVQCAFNNWGELHRHESPHLFASVEWIQHIDIDTYTLIITKE